MSGFEAACQRRLQAAGEADLVDRLPEEVFGAGRHDTAAVLRATC
jgi:hypothetical protein